MSVLKIEGINELMELIQAKQIKSALIGNGFSLSHPEYGVGLRFEISDILSQIAHITEGKLRRILCDRYNPSCPETALRGLRYYYIQCVLEKYIKIFCDDGVFQSAYSNYKQSSWQCSKFLKKINTIFTTNYDPVIYFEILKYNKEFQEEFQDGFNGDKYIKQKGVFKRLSGKEKNIYYLHGSWFIQADFNTNDAELRKCSFDGNSLDTIETIFNWEESKLPYLIFEDSFKTKDRLIKESDYLKGCLDKLEKTQCPILVFGMSFENDKHIIEALHNKQLYVACLESEVDRVNKLNEKLSSCEITYLSIPPDLLWEKGTSQ